MKTYSRKSNIYQSKNIISVPPIEGAGFEYTCVSIYEVITGLRTATLYSLNTFLFKRPPTLKSFSRNHDFLCER